jgi:hypothetical protein
MFAPPERLPESGEPPSEPAFAARAEHYTTYFRPTGIGKPASPGAATELRGTFSWTRTSESR